MCDLSKEEDEAMQCLLSCSSSCYLSLLAGPPLNNDTFSRWENVRPSAEYDLSSQSHNPLKTRKTRSINPLARGAISLPNIRSKFPQRRFSESYMSGHLDKNFSYVYTGGLSGKSSFEHEYKKESPVHHFSTDPLQHQGSYHLSTHTLALERPIVAPGRYAAQMDSRTRKEISTLVAMQLRPEVLADQLVIENRLRNLQLNAFSVLGTMSENRMSSEMRNGTKIASKSLDRTPPPLTVIHASQAQQSHRKRMRRKSKSNGAFEWCPLTIQECSSTDLPSGPYCTSHKKIQGGAVANQESVIAGPLTPSNETGLADLLEIGFLASNHMAHTQLPRLTGQGNQAKDKGKSPAYFGQKRFVVDNSIPRSSQDDLTPYRMRVPIVPSLTQKWPKAVNLRTKAFNDRLTMLHLPPTKFTASQSYTH